MYKKIKIIPILFVTPILFSGFAYAQAYIPSSSPNINFKNKKSNVLIKAKAAKGESSVITFSEYPLNTKITNQYVEKGILFKGSSPFIVQDRAQPTSPVLSGTPRFEGAIEGHFVDPEDASKSLAVSGFSLDAGYFDNLHSVRLSWFDNDGIKLGQKTGSKIGIQNFLIKNEGSVSSWRIETIADEPSGFSIDNILIEPLGPTLMFREKSQGGEFYHRFSNYIPGFDHVAMQFENIVYESNTAYPPGTYVDKKGEEKITMIEDGGVQFQHNKGTFEHNAIEGEVSHVSQLRNVPISIDLATKMRDLIKSKDSAKFYSLPYPSGDDEYSPSKWLQTLELLDPKYQKGKVNGRFTCVGLVEWSSEVSGHNSGQGFIPNKFESFSYPVFDDVSFSWPPVSFSERTVGLLSPELMYQSLIIPGELKNAKEWLQGFFDPADFIITDPIGRRFGHTEALGDVKEIPNVIYTGNGLFEQFLITHPIPGVYSIDVYGLGEEVNFAVSSSKHSAGVENILIPANKKKTMYFVVEQQKDGMGDVDGDGNVDNDDRTDLAGKIPMFTANPADPGDINGDGILNNSDIALLEDLIQVVNNPYPGGVKLPNDKEAQPIPLLSNIGLLLLALLLSVVSKRKLG